MMTQTVCTFEHDVSVVMFTYIWQDFNKPVGVFTQSVFIPDTDQHLVLTGTSLGCGVVWGPLKKGRETHMPGVMLYALARALFTRVRGPTTHL